MISPFESAATASNRERTSSLLSDDSGGSAGGKSELLSNGKKSSEKLSKEVCLLTHFAYLRIKRFKSVVNKNRFFDIIKF